MSQIQNLDLKFEILTNLEDPQDQSSKHGVILAPLYVGIAQMFSTKPNDLIHASLQSILKKTQDNTQVLLLVPKNKKNKSSHPHMPHR